MEQVRQWDIDNEWPSELFQLLADLGYFAMPFDEEFGGSGAGPGEMVVVAEELGRRGMDIAAGFGLSVFIGLTIQRHGSEQLRSSLLPAVLSGQRRLSVSITEPDAGSDAAAITTLAAPVEGGYRLRGQKVFTTGAGLPNTTLAVAARTGRQQGRNDVSVFVLDADAPGVSLRRLDTAGRHILGTYEVFLDDVYVMENARLGKEGEGWRVLQAGLSMERVFSCGAYLGSMATVLDLAVSYSRERKQFGQRICEFQAISHPIADMYTNLAAARLLTYHAARTLASGEDARKEISMAKLFVSEAYQQATNHTMQVFGGYGYMAEYDIERYWRDARIATVTAGTSQIQREILCRSLGMR
jgi:alkylation response protein AidB-like acyl-CoA dehydrogenase